MFSLEGFYQFKTGFYYYPNLEVRIIVAKVRIISE